MFLDINRIGGQGLSFERDLELQDLEGAGGEPIPVLGARMRGKADRGTRGLDLAGHLDASVRITCGRCVEPFEVAIATDFFLTLVPDEPGFPEGGPEFDDDDALLFHSPEGKADLRLMAAEQIYLNLPLKPICREGCKGLCPVCGGNRNLRDCGCRDDIPDPRLEALRELRKTTRDP